MGNMAFTLNGYAKRSDGRVIVNGVANFSNSYSAGGDTLDLTDYFESNTAVQVFPIMKSTIYHARHDGGTSNAGKVLLWYLDVDVTVNLSIDFEAQTHSESATVSQYYLEPTSVDLSSSQCDVLAIGIPGV